MTANSTIDISSAVTPKHKGDLTMPKLKEVWRFVKSLLSNFVQIQHQTNYLEDSLRQILSLLNVADP